MKVFKQEEYEDERLGEHAQDLLKSITSELGEVAEDGVDGDAWEDTDDEEWEGLDDEEDTDMKE
jgi:hypothetical protein